MKYLLMVLAAVAVVSAIGYYWLLSASPADMSATKNTDKVKQEQQSSVQENKTAFSGTGSLESLRAEKGSIECAMKYSAPDNSTTVEGTFFIHNKMIRGDFLTPAPDMTGEILTSYVMDATHIYTWSEIDGQKYGAKMSLENVAEMTSTSGQPVPLTEEISYDCTPWSNVDESVFVPPRTVIFQDADKMLEASMEYGTIYKEGEF